MFGSSKLKSINEARYLYLKSKHKPKEAAKPLDCLKNVDLCLFPPCKRVLIEQIKISWYITKLYKNGAVADPLANYIRLDCGFDLIDDYVHINGLAVNKFLKVQKMVTIQSWNIVIMNMLKRKMK